ncbi:unnamed protein product [Tuber melanosporum]|uniref:(Perigord truffle) hypothetical protein n=1 Tax=Tuber melanosporum (strain Mel28) TaxID=656061 RepID=D5GHK0_TUBMM|nr:uncharacterized protein GSTUM_00007954001 [Tuber melanosporum]CAZ83993.1 unnamed protein product [Tuber melanosporum]
MMRRVCLAAWFFFYPLQTLEILPPTVIYHMKYYEPAPMLIKITLIGSNQSRHSEERRSARFLTSPSSPHKDNKLLYEYKYSMLNLTGHPSPSKDTAQLSLTPSFNRSQVITAQVAGKITLLTRPGTKILYGSLTVLLHTQYLLAR